MGVKINQIVNANIYVGGNNLLGKASEVDAPEINTVMNEYKVLGLFGKFELPTGFDKMELRIKWNAFYQDVAAVMLNPFASVSIMIRANMETWEGGDRSSQVPVVIYATCQSKGFPLGKFKQQENVDIESKLSVSHCKLEIDGVEIVEFDAMNNIFKVQGVDQLAVYRGNVGG